MTKMRICKECGAECWGKRCMKCWGSEKHRKESQRKKNRTSIR